MAELSLIGKDTLHWTKLEVEQRFCGTDSDVISDAPVVNICHDMDTSQLNISTIRSQHMSAGEVSQELIHYVEAYADFGMQCAYDKAKTLMKYEAEKEE